MKVITVLVLSGYVSIGALLILIGISRAIFGGGLMGFLRDTSFAVVWPLAILSSKGRKYVTKTIKEWK